MENHTAARGGLWMFLLPLVASCGTAQPPDTTTVTTTTITTTTVTKVTTSGGKDEQIPPKTTAGDAAPAVAQKPSSDTSDAAVKATVKETPPDMDLAVAAKEPERKPAPPPGGMIRTTKEYFETLGERFQPKASAGVHAVIQFDLSGNEAASYHVKIDDGKMKLSRGEADKPTTTIKMKGEDYVKVVNNEMNGTAAVMRGAMKVEGDIGIARKMSTMFPSGKLLK